jgi:hypothetical protein
MLITCRVRSQFQQHYVTGCHARILRSVSHFLWSVPCRGFSSPPRPMWTVFRPFTSSKNIAITANATSPQASPGFFFDHSFSLSLVGPFLSCGWVPRCSNVDRYFELVGLTSRKALLVQCVRGYETDRPIFEVFVTDFGVLISHRTPA